LDGEEREIHACPTSDPGIIPWHVLSPYRRGFWERAGGYDERPSFSAGAGDWIMWLRALNRGVRGKAIPMALMKYYRRVGSLSSEVHPRRVQAVLESFDELREILDVAPGSRGQGVRSTLLARVEAIAQQRGAELLEINVDGDDTAARHLGKDIGAIAHQRQAESPGAAKAPWPSPITTSAVNEKRRPPFTTLATRLMAMTRDSRRPAASVTAIRTPVRLRARRLPLRECGRDTDSRFDRTPLS
jgi:GNAT superfamily N-acetyltransferase